MGLRRRGAWKNGDTSGRFRLGPNGREQYAARGAGEHDDMVMAVALAAWWLERRRLGGGRVGPQGRRLL